MENTITRELAKTILNEGATNTNKSVLHDSLYKYIETPEFIKASKEEDIYILLEEVNKQVLKIKKGPEIDKDVIEAVRYLLTRRNKTNNS